MVKSIKFSHNYDKFIKCNLDYPVRLLDVLALRIVELSPDFLSYDTMYKEDGETCFYSLEGLDQVLVLFFLSVNGVLFTTIRRYTDKKYKYYVDCIGDSFRVVINSRKD